MNFTLPSTTPGEQPSVGRDYALWVVVALSAFYSCWFYHLAMERYNAFYCALDFIQIDSACHGTAQGRFMWANPLMNNFFELHISLIILPVSAFYLFADSRSFIFLFQSACAGAAAVPLYLFARSVLRNRLAAFFAAAAYLVNGEMQMGVLFGYHDYAHFPLFTFATLSALAAGRWSLAAVSAALLLSVKEDSFITLAGAGLYALVALRSVRGAMAIWLTCALYAAIMFLLVLPYFRNNAPEPAYPQYRPAANQKQAGGYKFAGRYSWLSAPPGQVIAKLRNDRARMEAWGRYSMGFLFLPFISPLGFLMALGPSMELFLSGYDMSYRLFGHYPMLLAATWFPAAILGMANIGRISGRLGASSLAATLPTAAAVSLFCAQAFFSLNYGALPWLSANPGGVSQAEREHGRIGRQVLAAIPPNATMAAVPGLLSHLNHNPNAYLYTGLHAFPFNKMDVEYVAMDGFAQEGSAKSKWFAGDPIQLLMAPAYGLASESNGLYLFRKGAEKTADYKIFQERYSMFHASWPALASGGWRSPQLRLAPGNYAAEVQLECGKGGAARLGAAWDKVGGQPVSATATCQADGRARVEFTLDGAPDSAVTLSLDGVEGQIPAGAMVRMMMSYEVFLKNTHVYRYHPDTPSWTDTTKWGVRN